MFPSGLQMLFKSLGFDPADFAAKIEAAQKAAIATVQHFDALLVKIDSRLETIERLLADNKRLGERLTALEAQPHNQWKPDAPQ